ncbi:type I methionyl aminopeptidase [uncultured Jatrophihabitans sp.]|uniref:type I methionyl aminopeptidase n=1 Tax=uncultured Jatrophihabitans sp. TaxID=1610747 RepID=UPI0035CA61BF
MRGRPERIELKTPAQIATMRAAGLVVAQGLAAMRAAVAPGVSTGDLDAIARDVLRAAGARPNFLGYHGFPGVICASVNDRVVHGIPSDAEKLAEGDLISLDFGAIVDGWHGDSAITVPVGEVSPEIAALSATCEASMWAGIAAVRPGARLSDVSHAVETSIRGAGRYGIVAEYGGHGIGTEMHMAPHILNYGRPGKGPRLTSGMALAIEPMVTAGSRATEVLEDDWTVRTVDRSWAAHWEHTVAILDDGPWVLTAEDGGRAELGKRGVDVSALAA